jgi:hypothetical protein
VDIIKNEYGKLKLSQSYKLGSLLKLQWNDEYCEKCILRVRPVVERATLPGEDHMVTL